MGTKTLTKQIEAKQAEATMTTKNPDGSVQEEKEKIGEPILATAPMCNVGVGSGVTINLGDYNSAKLDVRINIPCEHSEIDEVFEFGKNWVDQKLQGMVDEVLKANGKAE
jgi:hypothetical protein